MNGSVLGELKNEIERTQVMVFAGGLGKRMALDRPKSLIEVSGITLLERCVRFFTKCGFSNFVFLLGYGHREIASYLGEGKRYGIRMKISVDSRVGCGRGASLMEALESGIMDPSKRSIITFPDDIFTDESLPLRMLMEHLYAVKTFKSIASLVLSRGRRWPYGVAMVSESGIIKQFEEKPFVAKTTSVGLYVFEPQVYQLAKELFKRQGQLGIEETLIPKMARQERLYSIFVPPQSWIPVNTQKDLEFAENALPRTIATARTIDR